MADCSTFDLLLVDWLYDELEPAEAVRFTRHIEGCDACWQTVESLFQVRTLMRTLPEAQPAAGISARILSQAAALAPASTQRRGLWAWLAGSLELAWAHPAAAALATLVLVAGVAGTLFVRGRLEVASPARAPAAERLERQPEALVGPMLEATSAGAPNPSTAAMPAGEQGESLDVMAPPAAAREYDQSSNKNMVASGAGKERARPRAPGTRSKLRGGLAMELEAGSRRDTLGQRDGESQRAPVRLAMDDEQFADVRAEERQAGADDYDDADDRARASAELRPGAAQATAPSEPAATAKDESERAQGRASARKADAGTWAESMHDALRAALRDQACDRAVRLADEIRARDPGYYRTRIADSKELAACRQAAAPQDPAATKNPAAKD